MQILERVSALALLPYTLITSPFRKNRATDARLHREEHPPRENDSIAAQARLQEDVQRFASRLIDRVVQAAAESDTASSGRNREELMRRLLLYSTSLMDIATGPNPRVNLMDMYTFVRLCREVLEVHWIPKVAGDDWLGLLSAFQKAEVEVSQMIEEHLTGAQISSLSNLVTQWRTENPNQHRVEGIRLLDFTREAGSAVSAKGADARGLLAGVTGALTAANDALLLANRAMFLGQRIPSIARLQVRLGTQELISDLRKRLGRATILIAAGSTVALAGWWGARAALGRRR